MRKKLILDFTITEEKDFNFAPTGQITFSYEDTEVVINIKGLPRNLHISPTVNIRQEWTSQPNEG